MPIQMDRLVGGIDPERTVLFFGSGSSLPSGAPTGTQLQAHFEKVFGVRASGYTLAEQTGIIENQTRDRTRLVAELRSQFRGVSPSGAILNLPLYPWKSLYTTNYDKLIEASFERKAISIVAYSTNFEFGASRSPDSVQLFKVHGTIDKDVVDGNHSRIILTENDYELTHEYRDMLYNRLGSDLAGASLVVIGYSLADPHIRAVVDRAVKANQKIGAGGRITLLMYNRDDGLATLHEAKGLNVFCWAYRQHRRTAGSHREHVRPARPFTIAPAGDNRRCRSRDAARRGKRDVQWLAGNVGRYHCRLYFPPKRRGCHLSRL